MNHEQKNIETILYKSRSHSSPVVRWFISLTLSTLLFLTILVIVVHSEKDPTYSPPPPIQLDYIVLTEKEKKVTKEPKKKPQKIVKRVQPKPKKQTITPPKNIVKKVQPTNETGDISTSSKTTEKTTPKVEEPIQKTVIPQQIRLTESVQLDNTSFNPIFTLKPKYPAVAQKAQIEGFVDIDLVINEKGRVHSFRIVKVYGHAHFGVETRKVIKKWRFPPPRFKGNKVTVKYLYRVKFTL